MKIKNDHEEEDDDWLYQLNASYMLGIRRISG